MARVTVEDCVDKIPNRFELVMSAAQRARKIGSGAPLTVERDNDKNPVISLREIAAETLDLESLKEDLIRSNQRMAVYEEEQDVEVDLMHGENEWASKDERHNAEAIGLYSEEDVSEEEPLEADDDDDKEPTLSDLAGN